MAWAENERISCATPAQARIRFATRSPIVISNSRLLDLNGYSDTVGPLTLSGGDITLGAGTLTLGGNVSVSSSDSVINGPSGEMNLPATRTFNVTNGVFFDLQSPVTGSGGLTQTGAGWMQLGYSGTFSGVTAVTQGQLEAYATGSLGATTSGTVVSNGAGLVVNTDGTIAGEALTLNGAGYGGYGALDTGTSTRTNTWTGTITLNSDSVIMPFWPSAVLILSGAIGGTGGLTKTGAGTLYLEGTKANTFGSVTYVVQGKLRLAKSNNVDAVPNDLVVGDGVGGANAEVAEWAADYQVRTTDLVINSSGLVTMSNHTDRVSFLSGSGNLDLSATGHLIFGSQPWGTVFNGTISGSSGAITKDSM